MGDAHVGELHSEDFGTVGGGLDSLLVGGGLVLLHLVRAWRVDDRTAIKWLVRRSLPVLPGAVADVRAWLVRVRWARAAGAVLMVAVAWAALSWWNVLVGFAIAPYLLSVLVAEHFLPRPAAPGPSAAVLEARELRQYVPSWAVWAARLLGGAAAGASLFAALAALAGARHFLVPLAVAHTISVSVALLATEAAHGRAVRRARPTFPLQDEVDHALRVASTRGVVGAFVAFASFGLTWSVLLVFMATTRSTLQTGVDAGFDALIQALFLLPQVGFVVWLVLAAPQPSRPAMWERPS